MKESRFPGNLDLIPVETVASSTPFQLLPFTYYLKKMFSTSPVALWVQVVH